MEKWLDIGVAAFALVAAIFWFLSAYGPLPQMSMYWGTAPPTDPFFKALKFSAEMNTWAAGSSGLSASLMALKMVIQSLASWRRHRF
jgi:hypothetical protein